MKRYLNLHRFGLKVLLPVLSAALAIINPASADTLTVLGRLPLPYCTNVFVQGNVCFVTDAYGLEAVDVRDRWNPVLLGRLALPDTAQQVILRDTIAFVSDADSGLALVNAARPESLKLISRWRENPGYAHEAALFQDTLYLAYGNCCEGRFPPYQGGLMKILISDPRNPSFAGFFASAYTDTFQPYAFRCVDYTSVGYSSTGGCYVAASVLEGDYMGAFPYADIEPGTYHSGPIVSDSNYQKLHRMALKYPFAYVTSPQFLPGQGSNFVIVHFSSPGVADTVFRNDLGGNGRGIWAESAGVYVSLGSVVKLLDVSVPYPPYLHVIAACTLDNVANGLQSKDQYVYVANGPYLTILCYSGPGVEENKEIKGSWVQGFKITPDPFITYATVPGHEKEDFELYDITGRKVRTCRGDKIGEGLAAGVYFIRSEGNKATLFRVIKVK